MKFSTKELVDSSNEPGTSLLAATI
jgi:hypothetical protein